MIRVHTDGQVGCVMQEKPIDPQSWPKRLEHCHLSIKKRQFYLLPLPHPLDNVAWISGVKCMSQIFYNFRTSPLFWGWGGGEDLCKAISMSVNCWLLAIST